MAKIGPQQVTCLRSGPPQLRPPPAISRAGRQRGFVNNERCDVIFREYSNGDDANNTPRKCNVLKRKFPDFSRAYSEDHSHLSGDESGDWKFEEENVTTKIAEENAIEELAACTLSDPVEEVTELDYLLENIEGEEGNADEEAKEGGGILKLCW
jgi:hypothetical protein